MNLYERCDTNKDCVGFPEGCLQQKNCKTVVTVISGNELAFEMMSLDSKYVAIGISEDRRMGRDYVAECVVEGDNVKSYESWNVPSRKENVRIPVSTSSHSQSPFLQHVYIIIIFSVN
uniref:DOMON domain-containing protein n=1 Tax=Rhodnius prolixus TaxID=13249 RepID=T1HJ15_RHOPR